MKDTIHDYRKPSAKAPVIHPGDEAPFLVWGGEGSALVAYPLLRVESEEVEVERLGGVPPGLLRPPSIEPFDL